MVTTNPIMSRLSEHDSLVRFSTRTGMGANERFRLLKEGFYILDSLLEIYHNMENLQNHFKNINKTVRSVTRTSDKS